MNRNIKYLFFDWGDTLMLDDPRYSGAMAHWPEITPMPGVTALLPQLSAKYQCVVVSNAVESDAGLMRQAFEKLRLDRYFHLFLTSKELGANKPEPAFFSNAIQKCKANAHQVLMIGNDYHKDIESAYAIGIPGILITDKAGNYPFADTVVENFSKLTFLL